MNPSEGRHPIIQNSQESSKARLFLSLQIVRQGDYDHVCLANKVNKLIGVLGITNLTPKIEDEQAKLVVSSYG